MSNQCIHFHSPDKSMWKNIFQTISIVTCQKKGELKSIDWKNQPDQIEIYEERNWLTDWQWPMVVLSFAD